MRLEDIGFYIREVRALREMNIFNGYSLKDKHRRRVLLSKIIQVPLGVEEFYSADEEFDDIVAVDVAPNKVMAVLDVDISIHDLPRSQPYIVADLDVEDEES